MDKPQIKMDYRQVTEIRGSPAARSLAVQRRMAFIIERVSVALSVMDYAKLIAFTSPGYHDGINDVRYTVWMQDGRVCGDKWLKNRREWVPLPRQFAEALYLISFP